MSNTNPKGLTRRDKLDMAKRRARGETIAAIAAVYGVNASTVTHHLTYEPHPRVRRPCGTPAAYRRHQRNGERPCLPCYDAWKTYVRERFHVRRAAS